MRNLLLVAALLAGVSASARAQDLGTLQGKWTAQDIEEVRVHFPVGELVFEPSDAPEIRAELGVICRHGGQSCVERSKRLRLVTHVAGKTRHIELEGMPKFGSHGLEVTLTIAVPKTVAVDAEMGVGNLRAEGIVGDMRLELGVGDVTVLAKQSDVKSVNLTVGIGDATLRHGGSAQEVSGLLGRKVRWSEGAGGARVSVELGVGDIAVRLD
jgi:hypothetical protein